MGRLASRAAAGLTAALLGWGLLLLSASPAAAQREEPVELPELDLRSPIDLFARSAWSWRQGDYEVWLLSGGVELRQGMRRARAREGVVWIDRSQPFSGEPDKLITYLEGEVTIDHGFPGVKRATAGPPPARVTAPDWFGRWYTTGGLNTYAPAPAPEPRVKPPVFERGLRKLMPPRTTALTQLPTSPVRPAQFTQPPPGAGGAPEGAPGAAPLETVPTPAAVPNTAAGRRIRVFPRSSVRVQARSFVDEALNERITVIDSGVQVIVEGIEELGKVDMETDRVVIWTSGSNVPDLSGDPQSADDRQVEFYLEGNIVFRQGDRVIYADRMYYNATQEYGVVLDAEVLTPIDQYEGLLRLKASVLQQINRDNFVAYGAAATSSRLGVPTYWFQSQAITLRDQQRTVTDPFTGQPRIDPATGELEVEHDLLATSRNNFLFVGGAPVFYWPVLATDLTKPSVFIDRVRVKSDNIFGVQLLVDFDAYQLLGWRNPPEGTKWTLSSDLLWERGPGGGTNFQYERHGFLGIPGPARGELDAWGIYDTGLDDLGAGRRGLTPEETFRYRLFGTHRQYFGEGWQLTGELGLVSDRNFLEQYYEREWDERKDFTTGLELKRLVGNQSWNLSGDLHVNDFFLQNDEVRLRHYVLGQSLFESLTWFAHSQVGYVNMEPATAPLDPVDAATFNPLPYEAAAHGAIAATRQEIDFPLEAGPVKVVPYLLGEIAYWGEDLAGDPLTRTYGQAGVRASMPMWRTDPSVRSELLNLNGLSHKVVFDADFFWAEASDDLGNLPLYDPIDDDAIEAFRRRIPDTTFGGLPGVDDIVPLRYDERFFALRYGLQEWVTSPSLEIADDLAMARWGVRQRWQTKRGPLGGERIIDWVVLDVQGALFPNASRDNFGQELGPVDYDFQWHVGDRLTLLSDGYFDFFGDGLRTFTIGGRIGRPTQGNLYVGYRSIEGPLSSSIFTTALSYRLSEKWIVNASTMFDLGDAGNIGQSVGVTRIGESALIRLGVNYDEGRDALGMSIMIEPRFLPSSRLGRVGGVSIPPAGAEGLE